LAVTALEKQDYIALHPYSRWRTKLWPWRYYNDLIKLMPDKKFVMIGEGPWFPIEAANCFDLRNKLPLPQLTAVLAKAKALVSTDSGPAHLGAALGTPTVVIFGATDWRKTRPIGHKVSVLRYPVPCAPCMKRSCPQRIPMVCMSEVHPTEVQDRLLYWDKKIRL
jgi:ADP-heptose:LPS heptosyltransferase